MARFVPAAQVQGGSLPTQGADGTAGLEGLSAAQILGLLKTLASTSSTVGKVASVPGAGYAGSAAAPIGLAAGIASGDPSQTVQGGLNTGLEGVKLADKLGLFAGELGAGGISLGGAAGLAGGSGAIGSAATGLGAATAGGATAGGALAGGTGAIGAPVLFGAAEGGALGAGVGGGVAAGGTTAATGAASGLSAGLGLAAIPLFFIAVGLSNMMKQKQDRIENQTLESGSIRRGAKTGLDTLGQTQRFLPGLDKLPADQLPGVLEQYHTGLTQWPAVQQLLATKGQGGAVSKSKPVDEQTLANVTQAFYPALRDTEAGYLWSLDAAARQGQPLPDWLQSFGQTDPAALLNNLSHGYMGTQQMLQPGQVDYSQAVPGNLVNFFQQQTAGDPKLAELFGSLPTLPGQAPTPEAMAQQSQARQEQAQALAQQMGGDINSQGKNIETLAYTAPYTPGGLQQSLTDTFGANAEEQAMIADQLARGGDPVGIRSVIQASREQQRAAGGGG